MRSTLRAIPAVFTLRYRLVLTLVLQLAFVPNAEAQWKLDLPAALQQAGTCLVNGLSDGLARLRGVDCSIARAEQLYDRGDQQRSLSLLRSALSSPRINNEQRAKALLYVGAIQTQLGNNDQAVRAFAGVATYQPDYAPGADAPETLRNNFEWGRRVASAGGTRAESIAALLPPDPKRPGLVARLADACRAAKDTLWAEVKRNPLLQGIAAGTIGRFNVWRAQQTLKRYGVPRFKVDLEADSQTPESSAYTRPDGTVAMDRSLSLHYTSALDTLAHEAYHVMAPMELTPECNVQLDQYAAASSRVTDLEQQLGKLSAGTAEHEKANKELQTQRRQLQRADKTLLKLQREHEGAAERFAGQVLALEGRPLLDSAASRTQYVQDEFHPTPDENVRYFMKGVLGSLEDATGVTLTPQKTKPQPPAAQTPAPTAQTQSSAAQTQLPATQQRPTWQR